MVMFQRVLYVTWISNVWHPVLPLLSSLIVAAEAG
jgi:hypothetical protein